MSINWRRIFWHDIVFSFLNVSLLAVSKAFEFLLPFEQFAVFNCNVCALLLQVRENMEGLVSHNPQRVEKTPSQHIFFALIHKDG